jgi:glycerol-3-phosphate acyltransferase PlsY
LIGALSFAVIVSKAFGLPDPHTYGSGNPGATNVLRTGNKPAAVLTLIGDGAKGWLAVFLAQAFAWRFGVDDAGIAAVALAVFVGHLWPVFFRFQGGKGVATAAGILFALDWRVGLGTLATWLIIAIFFRYSSLAALIAAAFAPFFAFFLYGMGRFAWEGAIGVTVIAPFFTALVLGFNVYAAAVLAIAALLVWRHADNIRKLLAGTESRIGQKKSPGVSVRPSAPQDPSAGAR